MCSGPSPLLLALFVFPVTIASNTGLLVFCSALQNILKKDMHDILNWDWHEELLGSFLITASMGMVGHTLFFL